MQRLRASTLVLLIAIAGCAPSGPGSPSASGDENRSGSPSPTLVVAVRGEPATLSNKEWMEGLALGSAKRFFNAHLTLLDERENPHPYLAEALPQLNTDSWRVFPDGRMETIYRLRPNLRWHDGTPLSAEDFVFAHSVYTTPELGQARLAPQRFIEAVAASDATTVVFRWNQPYPDAGILGTDFEALPRHLLQAPFLEGAQPDAFGSLSYWTRNYVGLGPYRLERWEPGAFIEGSAFEDHSLGRPRIDRVRIQFVPDPNTVLANLLAGAVHVALDRSLNFSLVSVLRREWAAQNAGVVLLSPSNKRWTQVQFRPEVVNPRALLDLRVRRALAHSIDRQGIIDGVYEGEGAAMDALVFPYERWFEAVDRSVTKYAYDVRRSEQHMAEAGFRKGADGFYASPEEGRLTIEVRVSAGAQNEQELAIMAEGWRRAGFEAQERPYPVAASRDGQFRATFPGLLHNSAGGNFNSLITSNIASPENRWSGSNRGAWSNPEYDRLFDAFNTTLDPGRRAQQVADMMKLVSDQLPIFSVVYDFNVIAHAIGLRGPRVGATGSDNWNAHQWELS